MNATPKGEKPDPDARPTWHEEVAPFPHAAIEHAMGHKVGGKVERAYTRTTLLDMRRKLMDAWAAYCEPRAGSNVLAFQKSSG